MRRIMPRRRERRENLQRREYTKAVYRLMARTKRVERGVPYGD